MEGSKKHLLLLIWLTALYFVGIWLFTRGFFLTRSVINKKNSCDVDFAGQAHNYVLDKHGHDGCWMHARFKKAIILIIDALRFDFVAHKEPVDGNERVFHNKFTTVHQILESEPLNSRLYRFLADPPTTTMQRLKGLTTGSLPTFVDASANFASAEISEDNIISQLKNLGKHIVFMGDDTWMGLYPNHFTRSFPYPSLNVKDIHTVDDGVIDHLNEELKNKNWDVLIGHFLGVDHCGHTYGPDHPIMGQKLEQMNAVLRNVTKQLDEDTVLIVFGDHGMTKTGDHGGDSEDELDSALFVYSKSQITSSPIQHEPYQAISQIDFVPTFSLLLGLPIPFSNLGSIVTDLFNHCPWWKTTASVERQLYHTIEALHMNAHQVRDYLLAYNKFSSDLSNRDLFTLDAIYQNTESELQSLMVAINDGNEKNLLLRLRKLHGHYLEYLDGVKEMCKRVWAKFDVECMVLGLVVTLSALFVHIAVYFYSDSSFVCYGCLGVASWIALICVFLGMLDLNPRQLTISLLMAGLSIGSISIIMMKVLSSSPDTKSKKSHKSTFKRMFGNADLLACFATLITLLYAGSLLSNSYVVNEDSVSTYFLQTLLWLQAFTALQSLLGRQTRTHHVAPKRTKSHLRVFDIVRPLTSPPALLVLIMLALGLCLRASHNFRACREEQLDCQPPSALRPLASLSGLSKYQLNFRYFLSAVAALVVPFTIRKWVRHYGNLTGFTPGVLWLAYGFPVSFVCLCLYWAMQALPPSLYRSLSPFQIILLPRLVYLLSFVSILIFHIKPLCIYLLPRDDDKSLPFGFSQDDLIPRVYNHLKVNWKRYLPLTSANKPSDEKPPVVYGLATVFSSSQILLISGLLPVLYLLLGDGMSPSLTLFLTAMFLILELWATSVAVAKLKDGYVSWSTVVIWGCLCSSQFFSTGHHATITAIRWESAYNGFHGDFDTYSIPAFLIGLNTFTSYVIGVFALPLLLYWPYFRGRLIYTFEKEKEESSRGEFALNEEPKKLNQSLFKLFIAFLLFFAIKLTACMGCAALHRRHLMVWKIFAPRYIYEGLTYIIVSILSFLAYLSVLKVNLAVDRWTDKLVNS